MMLISECGVGVRAPFEELCLSHAWLGCARGAAMSRVQNAHTVAACGTEDMQWGQS